MAEEDWVKEAELEDVPPDEYEEEEGGWDEDEEPTAVAIIYPTPLTCPLVVSIGMTTVDLSFNCLPVEVSVMVKLEVQSPDSMK